MLVGSSRERSGFDPTVDPALSDELRGRAAQLVPALAGLPVDDAWVGFRPWLPDNLPAIGPSRRSRACGSRPVTRARAWRWGR